MSVPQGQNNARRAFIVADATDVTARKVYVADPVAAAPNARRLYPVTPADPTAIRVREVAAGTPGAWPVYYVDANGNSGPPNLLRWSEALDNAVWAKSTAANLLTVTPDAATDPLGGTTADRAVSASNFHFLSQLVTVTPNTAYNFSFYAKNNGGTAAKYSIRNQTGGADIVAATSYFGAINGATWTRLAFTFTTPVGCTQLALYLVRDSSAAIDLLLWGAQLTVGPTLYPYQMTT